MDIFSKIYNNHNQDNLNKYLRSRGIVSDNPSLFYCGGGVIDGSRSYKGLFIVVRDIYGVVSSIINRNSDSWCYVYRNKDTIPIYNVLTIKDNDNVIVTESVLDAESINQMEIDNVTAISFLSSSFSVFQFHWLMFMAMDKNIILAFDNDKSGENSTNKFINLSKYKYGKKDIKKLSFSGKDVNEFINSSKFGNRILKNNIKEIIRN